MHKLEFEGQEMETTYQSSTQTGAIKTTHLHISWWIVFFIRQDIFLFSELVFMF